MTTSSSKSIMRSLGEFVGHIFHAVRTDPAKKTLRHETEQEHRGNMILRRTTIEEIELPREPRSQ